MAVRSHCGLFRRGSCPATLAMFLLIVTVAFIMLDSDNVIAYVDVVTQYQTRVIVYPNTSHFNAKVNEQASTTSVLQQLPTNSAVLDKTPLLQRAALDASASPLVRDLASLQLSLDAYVNGIEFRMESEGGKSVIRFGSKSKDHVSSWQKELQVEELAWDSCVNDDRVLVSGTSYTREIYFVMLRRLKRTALDAKDVMIPSFDTKLAYEDNCTKQGQAFRSTTLNGKRWCIYSSKGTAGCNMPGPAGVFIEKCGMPKSQVRHFNDVNMTVSFRLKTYLYTPAVDETILHSVRTGKQGLVVLGGGEWGRTSERYFKYLSAPELAPIENLDQARQFVGSVVEAMAPDSLQRPPLLVIYCSECGNDACEAFCKAGVEAQNAFLRGETGTPILVIRMTRIKKKYIRLWRRSKASVPSLGHGYSGAALDALTSCILSAYCTYRSPQ